MDKTNSDLPEKLQDIKFIFFDAGGTLLNLDAERICDHLQKNLDISLERVEKLEESQPRWLNCCCDEQKTVSD